MVGVQYKQAVYALSSAEIRGQMGWIVHRRGMCVCFHQLQCVVPRVPWGPVVPGDGAAFSSCSHSFSSFSFSSVWWNISFYFLWHVILTFLLLCSVLLLTSQLPQFSLYLFLHTYRIFFAIQPEELLLLLAYDQTLLDFPKRQEGAYLEK